MSERRRRSFRRRLRWSSALVVLGLGTATALPVILLSVGGGVASHELAQLEASGYQVAVSGAGLHGIANAHAFARAIDGLPNVLVASPVLSVSAFLSAAGRGTTPVLAEGVVPQAFGPTEGPQEHGLFPSPLPFSDAADRLHYANGTYTGPWDGEVMVSSPLALNLVLRTGDRVELGGSGVPSETFRIVGTFGVPPTALGPTAADAIVLGLADLQVLDGFANAPGAHLDVADTVQVALSGAASTNPSDVSAVASGIERLAPYYGVDTLSDQVRQAEEASAILTGFYLALSSVGLAVGAIFLALVLFRRVEVDRAQIGVRRALGVPAGAIARSIAVQAAVLAVEGAAAGILGAFLLVSYLARYGSGAVATAASLAVFDGPTLLAVTALLLGLALAASLGATRRALHLSIPEVLR